MEPYFIYNGLALWALVKISEIYREFGAIWDAPRDRVRPLALPRAGRVSGIEPGLLDMEIKTDQHPGDIQTNALLF
jgi:hypothetical protein